MGHPIIWFGQYAKVLPTGGLVDYLGNPIGGGGAGNSFTIFQPDIGTSPTASSATDTIIFTSTEIDITGNSGTKTLTFGLKNSSVISKVLTSYVSGAGTVAATDTILQAIQKLNGNQVLSKATADAALPSASFTDAAVTGKVITGYSSGAGTVASTDTILQAINKLNGNQVLSKATADAALPSASFTDAAVTGKVLTGYSSGSGTISSSDTILQAINKLNGNAALARTQNLGLRLAYIVTMPLN